MPAVPVESRDPWRESTACASKGRTLSPSTATAVRTRAEATLKLGRPVICTEYLNRPGGCTFQALLPYMKQMRIGAINWGFVAGKIQTQYPWASWRQTFTAEPEVWFHDVLRPDGAPFDSEEVDLIRTLTGHGRTLPRD